MVQEKQSENVSVDEIVKEYDKGNTESQSSIIVNVLSKYSELTEGDIKNAAQVLDFVQYLLDDDNNLTKTFNLSKEAKDKLTNRIVEVFESFELEEENILD